MEAVSIATRQLLIIEPCPACSRIVASLQARGWQVRPVAGAAFTRQAGDAVLICLDGPLRHELPSLRALITHSEIEWIAVLGEATAAEYSVMRFAVDWLFDYHCLPVDDDSLHLALERAVAVARLRVSTKVNPLADSVALGNCRVIRELRKALPALLETEASLFIQGESGTGKEMLARKLHQSAGHAPGSFVVFDDLIAADAGTLQAALAGENPEHPRGTLFVASLPTLNEAQQALLVEFLREVQAWDVPHGYWRLVVASDENLAVLLSEGRLHEALYQHLVGVQVRLPTLYERSADILLLAEHFARRYASDLAVRPRRFSDQAISALQQHDWPGNLRELSNRVRRAVALGEGVQIEASDLGFDPPHIGEALGTLADYILQAERQALNDVLRCYSKNMSQAARVLGISRPTFYRLLHKHRMR
ncbi:sigma 54-interacting transcriptional regulator [Pseudomonas sp. GD03944]|uniref:sigma-54-dependent transcriptional regulator n=1 Tax=Pseudomonas sp. GD03944 TaxID=2975409 RepID=UPI0024481346|nr:sigma 54-interacting transcriptional regulator [Pseudomonas sp. GD03944]MDH1265935.1 sigma 54-interacting transcriptional regulator [Pseudomonas sp. GD03944]